MTTFNPWSQCLELERRNILRHYLFRDKIIQNCLKIDATQLYDNDLLLRQETQKKKKIAYNISFKKHWFDVSSWKNTFLQDVFQVSAIVLISEINCYHIDGYDETICKFKVYLLFYSKAKESILVGSIVGSIVRLRLLHNGKCSLAQNLNSMPQVYILQWYPLNQQRLHLSELHEF